MQISSTWILWGIIESDQHVLHNTQMFFGLHLEVEIPRHNQSLACWPEVEVPKQKYKYNYIISFFFFKPMLKVLCPHLRFQIGDGGEANTETIGD